METCSRSSSAPTPSNNKHSFQESSSQHQNFHSQMEFQKGSNGFSKTHMKQRKKKKNHVFLQGYVDEEELVRAKSLTDEDLEELKGCLDLGFGFSYDEIPELCNTLPALELCYSMSQKFLDDHQKSPESPASASSESSSSPASGATANWKISSPGDDPEDVKARLKYWAQAVACTVRLCN
ncbi:hypothetical protein OSB04_013438 [Centaurea solstitialis]|uniref:Uncharacterized protein n=1 Tax=Centaurea solstitialis TaxID=347529 RepID=A0AA38TDA9_9ASTR|nr:hypothetical protein OSB04_013438 [Centaurea solstitialis]